MRRPSPIPRSSSPAEEQELSVADEFARRRTLRERLAPGSPDPLTTEDLVSDDSETLPIAPYLGTWGRADSAVPLAADATPARPVPEPSETPSRREPLSPRDLWKATRARRKTLRAEIRRFTQRSRRRRLTGIAITAAVLLVIVGSVGAAYSPLFAVQKITVAGVQSLDASVVELALADQLGTPLALVSTEAVKESLSAFPMIETYTLEAHPPNDLTVRVVERTPVGMLDNGAGYTVVDAAGVALLTSAQRPEGFAMLEIEGGVESPAFAAAGKVMRTLPAALRAQVEVVTASTPNDVRLRLFSGAEIAWGSGEDSALKAHVLELTMATSPGFALYDVSSPEAVVVG